MNSEDQAADVARNSSEVLMPPVTSQAFTGATLSRDARMAPPFWGRPSQIATAIEEPAPVEEPVATQQQVATEELVAEQAEVEPEISAQAEAEMFTFEDPFGIDLDLSETALATLEELQPQPVEAFPFETFMSSSATSSTPAAVEPAATFAGPAQTPAVNDLAEKLEQLSQRLRAQDADTVLGQLAAGDKLDAMLAGLLAGYLAGSK